MCIRDRLCTWPIYAFGTEEQKQKYLPDLCSGEKLGAFGLTEPGAGTDAAMQKTTAEDKGDHWVLNLSLIHISPPLLCILHINLNILLGICVIVNIPLNKTNVFWK